VTEAFVQRFSPKESPIGRHFGIGDGSRPDDTEIVGVVENAKSNFPRNDPPAMAFLPLLQTKAQPGELSHSAQYRSNFIGTIELRAAGNPTVVSHELRQALAGIDPNLTVLHMNTLSRQVDTTLNQENVIAELTTVFAGLALVLACIGLYGVLAHTVARRTNEIGIRLALGAKRSRILQMVLREALTLALLGLGIGIPVLLAVARSLSSLLYGLQSLDPLTIGSATLVLLFVAAVAAYLPAYRASRVDPMVALRYE
jgi:hypothetical protein